MTIGYVSKDQMSALKPGYLSQEQMRALAIEQSVQFYSVRMGLKYGTWSSPEEIMKTAREFANYIIDGDAKD